MLFVRLSSTIISTTPYLTPDARGIIMISPSLSTTKSYSSLRVEALIIEPRYPNIRCLVQALDMC